MEKISATIIFFGSGPVAAESLQLLAKNFSIEAVITKATTLKEMQSVSGDAAIFTVNNRQELDNLIKKEPFNSKIAVLIDFGIIVSQYVIDKFPLGIINSHFSLLPQWRGADPITFSLLSGQAKTGVSLMLIDQGMDTGKILAQKSLVINPDDTSSSLTTRLIKLSDDMLTNHLPKYMDGTLKPRSQPHPDRATYSRKLTKEDGIINWDKPAEQLEREIRAYNTWPKSRTVLAGKEVVITRAEVLDESGKAGDINIRNKDLIVFCGSKSLLIKRLKPVGKNEMTSEAFLAGHRNLF